MVHQEHFVRLSDSRTINVNHVALVEWVRNSDNGDLTSANITFTQGGQLELSQIEARNLKIALGHHFEDERNSRVAMR